MAPSDTPQSPLPISGEHPLSFSGKAVKNSHRRPPARRRKSGWALWKEVPHRFSLPRGKKTGKRLWPPKCPLTTSSSSSAVVKSISLQAQTHISRHCVLASAYRQEPSYAFCITFLRTSLQCDPICLPHKRNWVHRKLLRPIWGSFPIPGYIPNNSLSSLPSPRSLLFAADQGSASQTNLQDSEFHSHKAWANVHFQHTGLVYRAFYVVAFSSPHPPPGLARAKSTSSFLGQPSSKGWLPSCTRQVSLLALPPWWTHSTSMGPWRILSKSPA